MTSLTRVALLFTFLVSTGSPAAAQSAESTASALDAILQPGKTVWITDSGGQEQKIHIVDVSGGVVTAGPRDVGRRVRLSEITRVRERHSDSVINGALIGAGVAIASGLVLCSLTETWENCRDDVGPMFRIGALGAGIGIGIDALIRKPRTVFEHPAAARF